MVFLLSWLFFLLPFLFILLPSPLTPSSSPFSTPIGSEVKLFSSVNVHWLFLMRLEICMLQYGIQTHWSYDVTRKSVVTHTFVRSGTQRGRLKIFSLFSHLLPSFAYYQCIFNRRYYNNFTSFLLYSFLVKNFYRRYMISPCIQTPVSVYNSFVTHNEKMLLQ
jgi:hypothetical protein